MGMPAIHIEIIVDPASGAMTLRGPSDAFLCIDILGKAIQSVAGDAARKRRPAVETAGAAAMRSLPPVEGNGHEPK